MSEDAWAAWTGRSEHAEDRIDPFRVRALAATLDRAGEIDAAPGAELPGPWLWLHFLPVVETRALDRDGHPRRGGFLPPVPLPRRMWAGSRCSFPAPVHVGEAVLRESTILRVAEKTGRAGPMVFVTVGHRVSAGGRLVMEEEQDIVYMDIPAEWVPPPATPLPEHDWEEEVAVDPVLLFRFSALTFNGHRIHYDRSYAAEVEKYPGLVVHGPLQAILLHDAARRRAGGRRIARFDFRGLRPAFDHDALRLAGRARADGLDLWTAVGGGICMQATAVWG